MKSKVDTDNIIVGDLVLIHGNDDVQRVCKHETTGEYCIVGITYDDYTVAEGFDTIEDLITFKNLTKFYGTVTLTQ